MSGLKLIAMDSQDLAIIAAQVQDAITKPDMLDYVPSKKQFSLVLNRFAWDAQSGKRSKSHERRGSLLTFAGVQSVKSLGINKGDEEQVLSLLTVSFTPVDKPAGKIEVIFAGAAALELGVECVEVRLDDTGSAWETKFKPRHPLA